MKQVSDFILLSATALGLCITALASDGKPSATDNVLKGFPGYHLLRLDERNPETRAFLIKHSSKHNPSLVPADFDGDGDGNAGYSMLLKDESGKSKLVVLLCSADSKCKTVYELDETALADSVYLKPMHIGSLVSETEAISSHDQNRPVRLASTAIQVAYFEKGKVVLYWNPKLRRIKEVQTED